MSTAKDRVLGITELLENILSFLPTGELLLAQLVSTRFRDVIHASPPLQQSLFLQPIPARNAAKDSRIDNVFEHADLVRLLSPLFGRWVEIIEDNNLGYRYSKLVCSEIGADVASGQRQAALLRKEASWRRMSPVQPPLKSLSFSARYNTGPTARDRILCEDEEDFISLGQLYDVMAECEREIDPVPLSTSAAVKSWLRFFYHYPKALLASVLMEIEVRSETMTTSEWEAWDIGTRP